MRGILAVATALALAGCDTTGPEPVDGRYVLDLANGTAVPAAFAARAQGCEGFVVRSGSMELIAGAWSGRLETDEVCNGITRSSALRPGGEFRLRRDGSVTFTGPANFGIAEARSLPGGRLEIVLDGPVRRDTLEYGR